MCLVKKRDNSEELTIEEIFSLVDDASYLGVSYFSVTGGEPLLRNDVEKIGRKIKSKGIIASLSTNGTLVTRRRAKKLVKSFDYIRVSVGGLEKIHDKLKNKKSFKKVCKSIDHLTSIPNRVAKIGIACVINEMNCKELRKIFSAFKNKADFINFVPEQRTNRVFSNLKFVRTWKEMSGEDKLGDLEEFIGNPSLKEGKKYCDAAKLFLHIDSNGDVFPCLVQNTHPIGNLREKNLVEIWNSNKILTARKDTKNCVGCYTKCTTEISKIFRMNPLKIFVRAQKLIRTYRL